MSRVCCLIVQFAVAISADHRRDARQRRRQSLDKAVTRVAREIRLLEQAMRRPTPGPRIRWLRPDDAVLGADVSRHCEEDREARGMFSPGAARFTGHKGSAGLSPRLRSDLAERSMSVLGPSTVPKRTPREALRCVVVVRMPQAPTRCGAVFLCITDRRALGWA